MWQSSKISSWIWSVVSWMVTVLDRPGRGASQVEKSHFNWVTRFLTVAYSGAYSPNVSFRMAWISFGALPCRKKNYDSLRLNIVVIAHVTWHAFFQPLKQEKTCNSAHEQTPLPNDAVDSVLGHWEVGQPKDLSAPRRKKKWNIFKKVSQACMQWWVILQFPGVHRIQFTFILSP
jgi:hypothetical protein